MAKVMTGGKGLLEIITVTHTGMTTYELALVVQEWIRSAKHPETRRLYTEMVYQPMVELLIYLRSTGPVFHTPSAGIGCISVFSATPTFSIREAVEPAYTLGRY
jgi:hypothetical protein